MSACSKRPSLAALALGALLQLCRAADAQLSQGLLVTQDGVPVCYTTSLELDGSDFTCVCTSGGASCQLGPSVTEHGPCTGHADHFCQAVELDGKDVQGADAATMTVPYNTSSAPTAGGAIRVNQTTGNLETGDGVAARIHDGALNHWRVGGTGIDGVFSQVPTSSGTCSTDPDCDNICESCTGTRPACKCVLTPNSVLHKSPGDTPKNACVYEFTTFTITNGTVTCGQDGAYANTGAPLYGAPLVIRVQASPSITGGTFDAAGKGMAGGLGGSSATSGNRSGGVGGSNSFNNGGAGGLAGNNNGVVGVNMDPAPRLGPFFLPIFPGAGGGGSAGSGSNGTAGQATTFAGIPTTATGPAGTGGGGGGCSSAVASGTGGAGGRGGGAVYFETGGTWACSGATFLTSGSAGESGKAGSGGGGGAGVTRVYRALGTDTCTYTATAGAAGARTDATNCGTGAAGGTGDKVGILAPY